MDANAILEALKPATQFILDCLKKNDELAEILKKVGLDAIKELPENPLKAEKKLEERFNVKELLTALQKTFSSGSKGDPITVGDLEAVSLVAQVLLDIQRYYRFREISYVNRVARAGCHRSINTLPTGPVLRALQTSVQRTLREAVK